MRKIPLIIILIGIISIITTGIVVAGIFIGGGGGTEEVNLQKGLVGWWKFDGNAKDATANSNHGTVTGATLVNDRKGQALKAYSFDNIDDSFSVGNSGIDGNTWTWSAWLYWRTNNNADIYGGYLWSAVGGTPAQWIEIYLDKATRGFRITRSNPTSLEQVLSSATVTLNQWTFLTVTFNNGSLTGYIDTQSAGTVAVGALTVPVGASLNGYVPRDLDGVVDDIRVYNRVLSAAEITALYNEYDPGIVVSDLQKGLVGQWKMDGNAKDSTANSNHGTVTGATLVNDRKGQALKAYSFNGTSDYVDAGSGASLNFGTGDYTLGFWFRWTGPDLYGGFAMKGEHWGAPGNPFVFWGRPSGMLVGVSGGGVQGEMTFNTGGEDGLWHHFILTRTGETITVYSDTNYLNSMSISGLGNTNTAQSLLIGRGTGMIGENNFFKGLIDEVRIYNRALSQAEITALYQSYDPGIIVSDLQKGLVGQWKMNGNAKDSTANSNHGTVTGATLVNDRKGQALKAYSFNGGNDYVDMTSSVFNNSRLLFTIEWWMKPGAMDEYTYKGPWSLYPSPVSTSAELSLFHYYDNQRYYLWKYGDAFNTHYVGNFPAGIWAHVVITVNGTAWNAYKNGILISNGTFGSQLNSTITSLELGISRFSSDWRYWYGIMDEVRFYNRALSQAEITALYESY